MLEEKLFQNGRILKVAEFKNSAEVDRAIEVLYDNRSVFGIMLGNYLEVSFESAEILRLKGLDFSYRERSEIPPFLDKSSPDYESQVAEIRRKFFEKYGKKDPRLYKEHS